MVNYFPNRSPPSKLNDAFCLGSGFLEFEEFVQLAAQFLIEEDVEEMEKELKEAFRLYDKEGMHNLFSSNQCLF